MMKYPKEYLDEIKLRLKVSQIVGKTVKLKRRGKEFVGLSPFTNEKTPSFTVSDEKGFYHCFSSAEHGNIFDFIMKTQSIKFGEAVRQLASEAGMPPYRFTNFDVEKEKHYEEFEKVEELEKGLNRRLQGLDKCSQKSDKDRRKFYKDQLVEECNVSNGEVKERCKALKFFDCRETSFNKEERKLVLGQSDMLEEQHLCWTENEGEYCDDYVNWSIPYNLMIVACFSHLDVDFPIEFRYDNSRVNYLKNTESYMEISDDELQKNYEFMGIIAFPFKDNRKNPRAVCKGDIICCLTLYVYQFKLGDISREHAKVSYSNEKFKILLCTRERKEKYIINYIVPVGLLYKHKPYTRMEFEF